jgi:threonyl-tRNA synthetase
MKLIDKMYKMFGFEYNIELSTRPEKRIGNEKLWDNAEEALQNALEKSGFEFQINEGDGAFYGPKIDYHLKDAIGRTWQCGTIQLDMALPERFELEYDGKDGKKHRPVMLHRTIYGGIERFFGILIEHYAGKFPLWLSPNQVKILPIADRHMDYAKQVHKKLFDAGIRVEIDDRAESTNKKVRDAQTSQFNYILVVGDKEAENDTINIRTRDNVVHGEKDVRGFLAEILDEIKTRK